MSGNAENADSFLMYIHGSLLHWSGDRMLPYILTSGSVLESVGTGVVRPQIAIQEQVVKLRERDEML